MFHYSGLCWTVLFKLSGLWLGSCYYVFFYRTQEGRGGVSKEPRKHRHEEADQLELGEKVGVSKHEARSYDVDFMLRVEKTYFHHLKIKAGLPERK